jgi:phytoene dehydrogenase-like protein
MATAVVVGSGPNGLAAAVRLAQHGVDVEVLEAADDIGGGTRSSELTVPGVVHDHCSAFHPMGVGSPYLATLDLERHGLRWRWPEIDCAHPLDTGEAGLLWRSIDETASELGPDGRRWRQMFAGLAAGFDDLADDLMRPILHVPRNPLRLLRFGPPALLPAALTARVWHTDKANDSKYAANTSIHLTLNGDSVLLFNDRGELIRARLTAEGYHEISRVALIEPTYPWGGRKVAYSAPAYANRHVFARSDKELKCASLAANPE